MSDCGEGSHVVGLKIMMQRQEAELEMAKMKMLRSLFERDQDGEDQE